MKLVDEDAPTVTQAAAAISAGELSPLELTQWCLARAEEVEPEIKAFVTLDSEGALASASRLTDELAETGPRSFLHGIPIGIKDLIDVAGLPTTASSRILEGNIAAKDAPVVARLRAAGAVILGKTNTQEFAYGVVTRPTRNPWDTSRIPGGSSGGSAAAVAAGICPAALGTDTAGSIRIPAALCGVTGLKPARDRIPLDGIVALAPSLDVCGPIARGAEDCGLVWQVLVGAATPAEVGGLRVAVSDSLEELLEPAPSRPEAVTIEPEVAAATEAAAEVLRDAGAAVIERKLPKFSRWDFPRSVLLMAEALVVHQDAGWYPARAEDYGEETVAAHRFAEKLSAATLVRSLRELEALREKWNQVLEEADVLLLPSTPIAAPTVEAALGVDDGHRPPITRTLTRICGPVNVCGLAAVSVPAGHTAEGLPIGVQLIAREERVALAAAMRFQSLTNWDLKGTSRR